MKKISPSQIERLYQFTRAHFVEFYDVQTELVDHLANAIESHWEENPNDDFEMVLQQEFKKFGVFGFSDVVESRTKALNKKYNKLFLRTIANFFKVPRILLILLLVFIVYQLLSLSDGIVSYFIYFALTAGASLSFMLFGYRKIKVYRERVKQTERKWLFEDRIYHSNRMVINAIVQISNITFILLIYHKGDIMSFNLLIPSVLIVLLHISLYIIYYHIPKNVAKYLDKVYPEYRSIEVSS